MINEIYIKIEGLNLSRILDRLISGGVLISNLKIKNTNLTFSISENYLQKLNEICKKEKKQYLILKKTRIKRFFAKIPYFIGTFVSFFILFAFFIVLNGFILDIDIKHKTDATFDVSKVEEILLNNNIKQGMRKNKFSAKDIEKIILLNSNNVAGCEIVFEGKKLNITLFDEVEKNENSAKELLSKYNAVITSVECFSGDLLVNKGDLVLKNQVLIKSDKCASGKIVGKVFFNSSRIFNENQKVLTETGNIFIDKKLRFYDLFDLSKENDCNFVNFKVEKHTNAIFKNLFIPIYQDVFLYKELALEEKFIPFSDVEQSIKEELKIETMKQVPKGAKINNTTYSVTREGTMLRIDCFVETEINLFWEQKCSFFVLFKYCLLFFKIIL